MFCHEFCKIYKDTFLYTTPLVECFFIFHSLLIITNSVTSFPHSPKIWWMFRKQRSKVSQDWLEIDLMNVRAANCKCSTEMIWRSGSSEMIWRSGSTAMIWRSGSTEMIWRSGSTEMIWRSATLLKTLVQVFTYKFWEIFKSWSMKLEVKWDQSTVALPLRFSFCNGFRRIACTEI